MEENIRQVGETQHVKQDVTLKRAGQSSITLFVVFIIVLMSFGQAPVARVSSNGGFRLNFNIISCLGIAVGIYAFFFLLSRLRTILQLTNVKKTLGLIGGFGLILHLLLAFLMPLPWGAEQAAVTTGGYSPMARSGPEQWRINDKTYNIEATYYLALPEGLQYTIEYPWTFASEKNRMNDKRALEISFPLMKYAYEQELYKRTSIGKLGQHTTAPSRIGVTLFEKIGNNKVKGYRVALTVDEIEKRVSGRNK